MTDFAFLNNLLTWTPIAWEQYLYWQKTDKSILKRINLLIKDTLRNPTQGIGKPEPLKHNLSGFTSRRINEEHRLVYKIAIDSISIISCKYHY
jgi:toxin YoeB